MGFLLPISTRQIRVTQLKDFFSSGRNINVQLTYCFHLEKQTSKLCPAYSNHITWSDIPQTDGEIKDGEENEGRRERRRGETGSRGKKDTCPPRKKRWSDPWEIDSQVQGSAET